MRPGFESQYGKTHTLPNFFIAKSLTNGVNKRILVARYGEAPLLDLEDNISCCPFVADLVRAPHAPNRTRVIQVLHVTLASITVHAATLLAPFMPGGEISLAFMGQMTVCKHESKSLEEVAREKA